MSPVYTQTSVTFDLCLDFVSSSFHQMPWGRVCWKVLEEVEPLWLFLSTFASLSGESCWTFVLGKMLYSFPPQDIRWEMTVCVSGTFSLPHTRTHKTLEDVQVCYIQTDKAVVVSQHKVKVSDKHTHTRARVWTEFPARFSLSCDSFWEKKNTAVNASSPGLRFHIHIYWPNFPIIIINTVWKLGFYLIRSC